jgi:hypothetical protein
MTDEEKAPVLEAWIAASPTGSDNNKKWGHWVRKRNRLTELES